MPLEETISDARQVLVVPGYINEDGQDHSALVVPWSDPPATSGEAHWLICSIDAGILRVVEVKTTAHNGQGAVAHVATAEKGGYPHAFVGQVGTECAAQYASMPKGAVLLLSDLGYSVYDAGADVHQNHPVVFSMTLTLDVPDEDAFCTDPDVRAALEEAYGAAMNTEGAEVSIQDMENCPEADGDGIMKRRLLRAGRLTMKVAVRLPVGMRPKRMRLQDLQSHLDAYMEASREPVGLQGKWKVPGSRRALLRQLYTPEGVGQWPGASIETVAAAAAVALCLLGAGVVLRRASTTGFRRLHLSGALDASLAE